MNLRSPFLTGILTAATLLAGCQFGQTSRSAVHPDHRSERPDPLAAERQRETYVNSNYLKFLNSGRVTTEKEARALAAHDWEAHERHRIDGSTQTTTWSRQDRSKQAQQEFEADLAKLESK